MKKSTFIIILIIIIVVVFSCGVYLYKKIADSKSKIEQLKTENAKLENDAQKTNEFIEQLKMEKTTLENETQKTNELIVSYLKNINQSCAEKGQICLESLFTANKKQNVSNDQSFKVVDGGWCILRGINTSMPTNSDPDVGSGYAKMTKIEVNSIDMLRKFCTEEDFQKLLNNYCSFGSNRNQKAQFGVAELNKYGFVEISGGSSIMGNGYVSCR